MKKALLALAFVAFGTIAAQAQAPAAPSPKDRLNDKKAPHFQFIGGETYDFGTVKEGPDVEHIFKFKNTGKEPLIITNASASCGCTVPEFPKEPILPGKVGQLKVTFHTTGKSGPQQKTVFIQSNAASEKDRYEIYIKGTVTAGAQGSPAGSPAQH
jgi:hypothetical protein